MAAERTNLTSLPIACTLTPGDRRERLDVIRTLTREALVTSERDGLVLALRYAPHAVERVRAMVAGEEQCCTFLNFEIQEQPEAVHVTITAPENARAAADELFAQFIGAT
jgi:DNA-binding FadR family transcriptional regulator